MMLRLKVVNLVSKYNGEVNREDIPIKLLM